MFCGQADKKSAVRQREVTELVTTLKQLLEHQLIMFCLPRPYVLTRY